MHQGRQWSLRGRTGTLLVRVWCCVPEPEPTHSIAKRGWGIQDPGGNPSYLFRLRTYDWKQNPIYQTPTTYRDVVVANNRIHVPKSYFHDGEAVYNLSAGPGTPITKN